MRTFTRFCLALALAGCETVTSAPTDAATADAETVLDAASPRDAGPLPDASTSRRDDDGNTGFDDAVVIEIGAGPATGETTSADDYDYVRFEATAGQWIAVLHPTPEGGGDPGMPSFPPSVVLVGPDMRPLAGARDVNGCAGVAGLENELVVRVARSGPHYVEVYQGVPLVEAASSPWSVRVVDLSTSPASLIVTETASARVTSAHRCVLGAFETLGDQDELQLELPAYRALFPYDPGRHGSTGGVSLLELFDADGGLVARTSNPLLVDDVESPRVRLSGPAMLGENDSYILRPATPRFYGADVFFVESAEATNDALATPERMPDPPVDDTGYPAPFVLHVGPGDVDHIAIDITLPSQLELMCSGGGVGSSVRELELRLLAPDASTLALGRESATMPALLGYTLAPGRHVVRVSAPRHEPGLSGTAVLCSVYLGSTGGGGR